MAHRNSTIREPERDEEKKKKTAISSVAENIRKSPKAVASSKNPEKDEGLSSEVKQALIGAGTTLAGALFGGTQGAAVGAQAGKEGIQTFQRVEAAEKAEKQGLAARAAAQQAELAKEERVFGRQKELQQLKESFSGLSRKTKQTGDLRKERSQLPATIQTQKIVGAFARIQAAVAKPSAAGDLALIFNFMKMLDPGSVVRESEFRTAEQARAALGRFDEKGILLPAVIVQTVQKLKTGQKLLPAQRKDFVDQAQNLFSSQQRVQSGIDEFFRRQAEKQGIDPSSVIIDFAAPPPPSAAETEAARAAQVPSGPGALSQVGSLLKPEAQAGGPGLNQQKRTRLEELQKKARGGR